MMGAVLPRRRRDVIYLPFLNPYKSTFPHSMTTILHSALISTRILSNRIAKSRCPRLTLPLTQSVSKSSPSTRSNFRVSAFSTEAKVMSSSSLQALPAHYLDFFTRFYATSDDAAAHEEYTRYFAEDAKLTLASNSFQGRDGTLLFVVVFVFVLFSSDPTSNHRVKEWG
jgi:hypothetical protein